MRGLSNKLRYDEDKNQLDGYVKQRLYPISSQIVDACIPGNQLKKFPENAFSLMTVSGAKGEKIGHVI
jgi:hypothetical protein